MNRRQMLAAIPAAAVAIAGLAVRDARAAEIIGTRYTEAGFAAAQKAGKPILVFIEAGWCPTCAKQRPIVSKLLGTPEFKNLVVLDVDFDDQKDVVRAMGARMQSTLVVFKGGERRGMEVGVTDEAPIAALLKKAVA